MHKTILAILAVICAGSASAADLDIRALLKQAVDNFGPKPFVWVDSNGKVMGRMFDPGSVELNIRGEPVIVGVYNIANTIYPPAIDQGVGSVWIHANAVLYGSTNCTGNIVGFDSYGGFSGSRKRGAVYQDLTTGKEYLVEVVNAIQVGTSAHSLRRRDVLTGAVVCDQVEVHWPISVVVPGGFIIDLNALYRKPFFFK